MVHAIRQIDRGLIADEEETMSDRINNSESIETEHVIEGAPQSREWSCG
jgi:hypothetical protein